MTKKASKRKKAYAPIPDSSNWVFPSSGSDFTIEKVTEFEPIVKPVYQGLITVEKVSYYTPIKKTKRKRYPSTPKYELESAKEPTDKNKSKKQKVEKQEAEKQEDQKELPNKKTIQ